MHINLLYMYVGINKGVLMKGIIYLQKSYDLIAFTREISLCHEYNRLCCENQKYYIYSLKYYTYISFIYMCGY